MTTENKHTPGPWAVVTDDTAAQVKGFPCIHSDNYIVVGVEGMYGDIETDYANARLIAAAPDLLEALERLATFEAFTFEEWGDDNPEVTARVEYARAAIAKARGQ